MRVLLTSGGTRVPIDRVRHIGNMSRGTFGSRIALELLRLNDRLAHHPIDALHFLHAKESRLPFGISADLSSDAHGGVLDEVTRVAREFRLIGRPLKQHEFSDFQEYEGMLARLCFAHKPHVVILAAAVSDFLVRNYVDGKVRTGDGLEIELRPAPKLISMIKPVHPECKLVGFKLLVDSTDDELEAAARESIERNGCDLVVANDLRDIREGKHRVMMVRPGFDADVYEQDSGDPMFLARIVADWSMNLTAED